MVRASDVKCRVMKRITRRESFSPLFHCHSLSFFYSLLSFPLFIVHALYTTVQQSCDFFFFFVSFQITTLINHKDKLKKTEKTLRAIQRVGQAVSVAVSRFVAVGEAIAVENEDLKDEMGLACFEARRAGRSDTTQLEEQ